MGAACAEVDLPLLPGVATASELMLAYADGFRFMKFFPAVAAGGVPVLQALGPRQAQLGASMGGPATVTLDMPLRN